eukprot:scaffold14483_cov105-Isochrysis_galbana.AAC.4
MLTGGARRAWRRSAVAQARASLRCDSEIKYSLGWSTAWCAPCCVAVQPPQDAAVGAAWCGLRHGFIKKNCWREPCGAWREIDQNKKK